MAIVIVLVHTHVVSLFLYVQLPNLESQGVTHVVCVRQDIEANFIKPNFQHTFR